MYEIITKNLANKLKINEKYITNVLNLLEEGNTIAFIARYRKELPSSSKLSTFVIYFSFIFSLLARFFVIISYIL